MPETGAIHIKTGRRSSFYHSIIYVIAALFLLSGTLIVWNVERTDHRQRLDAELNNITRDVSARIETFVSTRLAFGELIRKEWQSGRISFDHSYAGYMDSVHQLFPDFQAINWVDNSNHIRLVSPLKGNEAALNLDLTKILPAFNAITAAKKTNQTRVTSPITLAQGGNGIVAYIPLSVGGSDDGFLNIVFRIEPLVRAALEQQLLENYHVYIRDNTDLALNTSGRERPETASPFQKLTVGNRQWEVSIFPTENNNLSDNTIIGELILIVGFLVSCPIMYLIRLNLIRHQNLTASEVRFRNVATVSTDFFWETDENLKFSFISSPFEDIVGIGVNRMIGKHLSEMKIQNVDPVAWKEYIRKMQQHQELDEIHVSVNDTADNKTTLAISGKPVFEDDIFSGYVGVGRDISRRVQILKEKQFDDDVLRTLANHLPIFIHLKDINRRIIFASSFSEQWNLTPKENLLGKTVFDLYPEKMAREIDQRDRDCLESGEPYDREVEYLFPDGVKRYVNSRRFPVFSPDGKVIGVGSIIQDISYLKETETVLQNARLVAESANKAKTDFLAHMSHELRSPLNSILGFSQIMSDRSYGDHGHPKYLEYSQDILESGSHLLQVINDILDLSKVEAGELELDEETFDIHECIKSCQVIISGQSGMKTGRFESESQTDMPHITADRRILRQIMLNIFSNSHKFTPDEGKIKTTVFLSEQREIIISIEDTGMGISASDLEKVIEPYGQSKANAHLAHEGTGLGLPLSKRFMELHNGSLEIQSAVGIGTTVTLIFPASRTAPQ